MKDISRTIAAFLLTTGFLATALLTTVLTSAALCAEPGTGHETKEFASLDITAPAGTQITVDGRPRPNSGPMNIGPIKNGELSQHELTARFEHGGELAKTLLLRGGLHYRVPVSDPRAARRDLVVQTGHAGGVWSVAFAPDGKSIATGGTDSVAILWDAATGLVLRRFTGHTRDIGTVAFSPDGRTLLTASLDQTAILWDVATGAIRRKINGGDGRVAFSPDGQFILRGSYEGCATLVETATGRVVRRFETDRAARVLREELAKIRGREDSEVGAVAFSPDGKRVVTGEPGNQTVVWDAATATPIRAFPKQAGSIIAVAVSPDNKTILNGTTANTAALWNAATGDLNRILYDHASNDGILFLFPEHHWVSSVAFSPDGQQIVTGSWDQTAVLSDAHTGAARHTLRGHTDFVTSAVFSPDGKQVLTGARTGGPILWDAATGKRLRTFSGSAREARCIAFSPDEKSLAVGYADGTAVTWDTTTGAPAATFETHQRGIDSVAFTPDSRRLLTGSTDGAILWDVAGRTKLQSFAGSVRSEALTPDGKTVLTWPFAWSDDTAGEQGVLWDLATGKRLRPLKGDHPGNIKVAFSADSKQAAIGDWSGRLHVDAIESGAETWRVPLVDDPAVTSNSQVRCQTLSVAFAPDGKHVLAGLNLDNAAILADASTRKQLRTLKGHTGWVESVAFSPDGRQILTGSADQTAALWDTATGTRLAEFKSTQPGSITTVRFSPNGRFVLAVDQRGQIHLWDIATSDELCRIITLDRNEWLTVTPQGLFDGPSAATSRVRFATPEPGPASVDAAHLVPADKVEPNHSHPGLLADLLKGERPQP